MFSVFFEGAHMASMRVKATVCAVAVVMLAAACNRPQQNATTGSGGSPDGSAQKETYPEPRWPAYFRPAKGVDDLMPAARALVRNRSGLQGNGMGILKEGE